MSGPASPAFAFGPFRLDPQERVLFKDDEPIALTPKAFELLACLVAHAGRLVTKEELLAEVWPGTFVEEAVLSVNMSAIRKALGDDRNGHTYVETVPRRGYRFVAPVRRIDGPPVEATSPMAVPKAAIDPAPPPTSGTEVVRPGRFSTRLRVAWVCVLVAIVTLGGATMRVVRNRAHAATGSRSIAVLPLRNLSSGTEQEQFAAAMTDLLITDLGRIPALRVVSAQSVMQYKDSRTPMPEIARDLKVDYIAEGTVVRDGDRVRITAQLIHGASDRHVWAKSYERDLRGTFAMQTEVAESIAREVGVTLSGASTPGPTAEHVSAEAYEAYLRGNYLADSGNARGAIEQYRKAIALYPGFSEAYARTASAYFDIAFFGQNAPQDAFPNMRDAALKAIEADANSAEGHAALAEVKLHYDWDWKGADREFRRSLELNPSNSSVRHLYAHYLLTVGRSRESLDEMDRAFEIDPVGVGTAT